MQRIEMKRARRRFASATATAVFAALAMAAAWTGEASAQAPPADMGRIMQLLQEQESRLDAQDRILREQQQQLSEQRQLIERQRAELQGLTSPSDADLAAMTGTGAPAQTLQFALLDADMPVPVNRSNGAGRQSPANSVSGPLTTPERPVGEAPPEATTRRTTVEALPEGAQLDRRGRFTIEPSIEYSNASSDRLVFRGAVIINTVQVGLIEANDTSRDTVVASLAARYQLTDRLEVEGRVPWMNRNDRVTTLVAGQGAATQTTNLKGSGLGDAEVSARYQLNRGVRWPTFVASARYKSDTGTGPFDVARVNGVATELPTGSGFWGVQGGISMLYPTDPAVVFASLSYLYNAPKDVDASIDSNNRVSRVDPGDTISGGVGFGFALNDRFSYSLGYSHSYIRPTSTTINSTDFESTSLQVGVLQLGLSMRMNERTTVSTSFDIGVTNDAPDVRVSLRTPFRF